MIGLTAGNLKSSVFSQSDFRFNCRGYINMTTTMDYDKTKQYIWKFCDAHRSLDSHLDNTPFGKSQRKIQSNHVKQKNHVKQNRHCDYCSSFKERKHLSRSHDTSRCFYGNNPGLTKLNQESDNIKENKPTSSVYSPTFHDSGSTLTSFFKDRPQKYTSKTGLVSSANSSSVESNGVGSIKFGKMELDNVVHVPTFGLDLISGIQIMKNGYKQVIQNDRLEVYKDDELVATGHKLGHIGKT